MEAAFPDGALQISEHDGMACLYAPTIENIIAPFKDREYLENVFQKEAKYVDLSSLQVCIGYEEVYIENGMVV